MRIAIMGSGGVGGLIGGQLVQAGEDVTFIARGANLEALRTHGLAIKSSALGDFASSVVATDDPVTIGVVDLVLVCVKTYDLDAAAITTSRALVSTARMRWRLANANDITSVTAAASMRSGSIWKTL